MCARAKACLAWDRAVEPAEQRRDHRSEGIAADPGIVPAIEQGVMLVALGAIKRHAGFEAALRRPQIALQQCRRGPGGMMRLQHQFRAVLLPAQREKLIDKAAGRAQIAGREACQPGGPKRLKQPDRAAALLGDLARPRVDLGDLRRRRAGGGHQRRAERDRDTQLPGRSLEQVRQLLGQAQRRAQQSDRFMIGGPLFGALAGQEPKFDGPLRRPGGPQMAADELGLALDQLGKTLFQDGGHPCMQLLPHGSRQRRVSRVAHQHMLEPVVSFRRGAAAEQQAGLGQLAESGIEIRAARGLPDQLVAKLPSQHRAGLGNHPGRHAEPVETTGKRGLQHGRDSAARRRAGRQDRGKRILPIGGFEHRLAKLLGNERHAFGALHDLPNQLAVEPVVAGQAPRQCRTRRVVERRKVQVGHLRALGPVRAKFRSEGDQQQHAPARDPLD